MDENEANIANVTEIEGRLDRLATKLRSLVPGSEAHAEVKEDMEDYYERLVQIKQMRVATLEEELKDMTALRDRTERAFNDQTILCLALIMAVLLLLANVIEFHYPGLVTVPVNAMFLTVLNSTPALMLLTGTMVHVVTLWLHPGAQRDV